MSAHENNTAIADDSIQNDNIKDLIDNCEDNGVVSLEEKTYYLNSENETHIILNKTVTIEGVYDKTIIDGNNTSLMLDVNQTNEKEVEDGPVIGFWRDGYVFKYLGKNVTFKNITFKDLKMTTWHEMKFENCRFINTTFTSYEYSNTFKNCSFDKSKIEIALFFGYGETLYKDISNIINCNFYDSGITFKRVYTPNYIEMVGGDQFRITNSLNIKNSNLFHSNITLYHYNVTVDNSSFNNSNIMGSSNIFNISQTDFNNPDIKLSYSEISLYKSNLTNPKLHFNAGYFSNGCKIVMKNIILSNCKMESSISYGSRKGSLKIEDSVVINSTLASTYSNVLINNSEFNRTQIVLSFADTEIRSSLFTNDGNITDTIQTIDYNEVYVFDEEENPSVEKEKFQIKTNYIVEDSYLVNASGKYMINAEDINIDTTNKILVNQSIVYYFNDKLIIKVEDSSGNPVNDLEILIQDLNDTTYYLIYSARTDSNGIAEYTLNKVGNYNLKIYYKTRGIEYNTESYGIIINLTVMPSVSDIKINKVNFASNTYSKINSHLEIKAVANEIHDLNNLKFAYKVYTNGKAKTYYSQTNSKGVTTFKLPKSLTAGNHKIEIRLLNTNIKKTVTVKIAKAKTTVKAPKVTGKFKKSKYFKVTVKNQATKKLVSNLKVKIKVYSGKKYKTYTVKTNKKGMAKINTNKLKKGKHKVVISSGNSNYKISKISQITIK